MKILALECSEQPASCALWEDGNLLCESFVSVGLTHSRTLMPMLEDMLNNAGQSADTVDRLAVTVGPGSFTGLRIGIAAIKGLALARQTPCVGLSTLEAAAFGAVTLPGLICPVMDARCQQVYNGLFSSDGTALTRLCEDRALAIDALAVDLEARLREDPACRVILTGNGVDAVLSALNGRIPLTVAPAAVRSQRASSVAALAATRDGVPAGALLPAYLRLPQAERELKSRVK